jgi:hypothetical protein
MKKTPTFIKICKMSHGKGCKISVKMKNLQKTTVTLQAFFIPIQKLSHEKLTPVESQAETVF